MDRKNLNFVAGYNTVSISDTIQRPGAGGEVRTTPPISSMDPVTCSSPPVQLQNKDILEVRVLHYWLYISCTFRVHCMYIVCAFRVHCVYIVCTLCVHCVYIVVYSEFFIWYIKLYSVHCSVWYTGIRYMKFRYIGVTLKYVYTIYCTIQYTIQYTI